MTQHEDALPNSPTSGAGQTSAENSASRARLEVIDNVSSAGGAENEDRAGAGGALAWVIDGATDVVGEPIAGEASDAAWLAAEIDRALCEIALSPPGPLAELPALLAERLCLAFDRAKRREPNGRAEHPSAAATIVRVENDRIDYVALGDCSLIARDGETVHLIGTEADKAGDRWVVDAIAAYLARNPEASIANARAELWGRFGNARARMNTPDGYGIFSITAPPSELIRHGTLTLPRGSELLLATDGLMRLSDVFSCCDAKGLLERARERGLASLIEELRALEAADADCARFPRAKVSDDATGLLLRLK